ncbi:hypothetical protein [Ruminococcus sp. 5_1_39BFAA]|uniref:hypothetical protein n=1 Tax=Ruminococcus sp. 5_1_39BFAA TaxID=457412 RepID=UPI0035694312
MNSHKVIGLILKEVMRWIVYSKIFVKGYYARVTDLSLFWKDIGKSKEKSLKRIKLSWKSYWMRLGGKWKGMS